MVDYKKVNLDSYNKNADAFSKHYGKLTDASRRKEFGLFVKLLPGKKILDIGCGPGYHLQWFKQQGLEGVGIDFSKEMIKICKAEGLNAVLMDLEDLKFKDNSFDGVWGVTSLLHTPKDKIVDVFNKIHSILKERGVLFIVVKEGRGGEFVQDKINPGTKRYFVYWTEKELRKIFKDRFEIIDFWKAKPTDSVVLHFMLRKK